jgi:mRNA-degrading endonuclease HigB of HigAB toxin-antitoxin module
LPGAKARLPSSGWFIPCRNWWLPDANTTSDRQVLVFNVCGNDYRLIVAAHFNRQMIYTLRLMTHAEYSKDEWKKDL